MIDSDDPTPRDDVPDAPDVAADPPHPDAGDEDVTPAFDIDLEPDQQGTAEAAAEPSG